MIPVFHHHRRDSLSLDDDAFLYPEAMERREPCGAAGEIRVAGRSAELTSDSAARETRGTLFVERNEAGIDSRYAPPSQGNRESSGK